MALNVPARNERSRSRHRTEEALHNSNKWVVKRSNFSEKNNGQRLETSPFRAIPAEIEFGMHLYPDGQDRTDVGFVAIFLYSHCLSQQSAVLKKKVAVEISIPLLEKTRKFIYTCGGNNQGYG